MLPCFLCSSAPLAGRELFIGADPFRGGAMSGRGSEWQAAPLSLADFRSASGSL